MPPASCPGPGRHLFGVYSTAPGVNSESAPSSVVPDSLQHLLSSTALVLGPITLHQAVETSNEKKSELVGVD